MKAKKEDHILKRLIDQEKFLDQQLKSLEKKYSEIGLAKKTNEIRIDTVCRETLMQRAEQAHQELRNYFAKMDQKVVRASDSSTRSTADENTGSLQALVSHENHKSKLQSSQLPPIDLVSSSMPGTATNAIGSQGSVNVEKASQQRKRPAHS